MKIKKTLDISIDMAREWYNGSDEVLRKLALEFYSVDELKVVSFEEIKTFEDAVNVLNLDIDDVYITINRLEKISKAFAAMFKLNIIRKALNSGQDMNLTENSGKGHIHYPYIPLITKDSTYYDDELKSGTMEIIGRFSYKNNEYYVLGGSACNGGYAGLGGFDSSAGVCYAGAGIGFLGCANKEIAQHLGKYFGMLVTEAKYGDLDGFEILDFVKTKNADEKEYSVECSVTYNGHVKVNAESQEDAIEKAERLMDSKYGDDFPNYGKFGLVTFKFSDATADSAYEV